MANIATSAYDFLDTILNRLIDEGDDITQRNY